MLARGCLGNLALAFVCDIIMRDLSTGGFCEGELSIGFQPFFLFSSSYHHVRICDEGL